MKIKDLLNFIGPIGLLFFFSALYFYFNKGLKRKKSIDNKVNDAIYKLDEAINQFGTNEDLIYDVFNSLSSNQINLLFIDFGSRYYNKLTGKYSLFQFLQGYAVAREQNLKSILISELNDFELSNLKEILKSKNIVF